MSPAPFMAGIYLTQQLIVCCETSNSLWKLGIDGKKITRGRGKLAGDVDCWGFEKSPTLAEKQKKKKTN